MKATWEIALDLLERRARENKGSFMAYELEWAIDELRKEMAVRPRVVWCDECIHAGPKQHHGLMSCQDHEIWVAAHDYCSTGISRLKKLQEDAELEGDPKDELEDDEYHRKKEELK